MEINLDGNNQAKMGKAYGIPQDSYQATITEIGEPFKGKGYKPTDPEIEKIWIKYEVKLEPETTVTVYDGEETPKQETVQTVELKQYLSAKITKGSGEYSNSKLYDLIEAMQLKELIKEENGKQSFDDTKVFVEWLRTKIVGASVKVQVKNSKEKGISRVNELLRVLTNNNIVSEEKIN